jgi:hypothetical protein
MGWISDLDEVDPARLSARSAPGPDIEQEPVVLKRYVPRRSRRRWIERDTPIIPAAVAGAVWPEASAWLGVELTREWIRRLTVRANVIYFHNPRFRRKIRSRGITGRDWLWIFTRHWLAAMIRKRDYALYTRLPDSHSVGGDLPDCRRYQNGAPLHFKLGGTECHRP